MSASTDRPMAWRRASRLRTASVRPDRREVGATPSSRLDASATSSADRGIDQTVISRIENGKQYGLRWSRFADLVDALGGLEGLEPPDLSQGPWRQPSGCGPGRIAPPIPAIDLTGDLDDRRTTSQGSTSRRRAIRRRRLATSEARHAGPMSIEWRPDGPATGLAASRPHVMPPLASRGVGVSGRRNQASVAASRGRARAATYQAVVVAASVMPSASSQRSASMAALQPSAAAVTAWR